MTTRIITGDCRAVLASLPSDSVHCCITSPPYYGLRDYGIEPQVWGGSPECEHEWGDEQSAYRSPFGVDLINPSGGSMGKKKREGETVSQGSFCLHCTAWRGSLGLEPTPALWVEHMVAVFREVKRVLRKDGTLFLNVGDSYASANGRAYDIADKAQSSSHQNDLISIRLCGECRADLLAGRILRNGRLPVSEQSVSPEVSTLTHTGFVRGHLANSDLLRQDDQDFSANQDLRHVAAYPGGVVRDAQASTILQSSEQSGASCSMGESRGDVCQGCARSLADYVPLSVHMSGDVLEKERHRLGTASHGEEQDRHNQRTSSLNSILSAYQGYTTAYSQHPAKPKDLLGMPWMLAFALRDDGWYLRSEITWAKKSCMPESVTDRPTSATEKVFLLAKRGTYFFDAQAVAEPAEHGELFHGDYEGSRNRTQARNGRDGSVTTTRNLRNWWLLGPEPFAAAHFATFPTEIPRRAILAGTSAQGVCPQCGAPWERMTEAHRQSTRPGNPIKADDSRNDGGRADRMETQTTTIGWHPTCRCDAGDPGPATVLDCFFGAGTTGLVADQLQRDCIGIELNPAYAAMAERRVRDDCPLFAEIAAE